MLRVSARVLHSDGDLGLQRQPALSCDGYAYQTIVDCAAQGQVCREDCPIGPPNTNAECRDPLPPGRLACDPTTFTAVCSGLDGRRGLQPVHVRPGPRRRLLHERWDMRLLPDRPPLQRHRLRDRLDRLRVRRRPLGRGDTPGSAFSRRPPSATRRRHTTRAKGAWPRPASATSSPPTADRSGRSARSRTGTRAASPRRQPPAAGVPRRLHGRYAVGLLPRLGAVPHQPGERDDVVRAGLRGELQLQRAQLADDLQDDAGLRRRLLVLLNGWPTAGRSSCMCASGCRAHHAGSTTAVASVDDGGTLLRHEVPPLPVFPLLAACRGGDERGV